MRKKVHIEKCPTCGVEYCANNLARHIRCSHGEEAYLDYKKYLDNRLQKIEEELHKKHIINSRNKLRQCPYCDRQEINISILKRHIKKDHDEKYESFLQYYDNLLNEEKNKHKEETLKNSKTNVYCEICGELFPSKQIASHIKWKHGHNEYLKFKEKLEKRNNDKHELSFSLVKCPICNKEMKSLNKHIFHKHNLTVDEFRKNYPDIRMQSESRTVLNIRCDICNKTFMFNNSYVLHLKKEHPEKYDEYLKEKDIQKNQGYFKCRNM